MSNLGSLGGRPRWSTNGILGGGMGAVPSQWTPDSRVKSIQAALNAQMGGAGCTTALKTDGLIGPMTCGALAWSKATGSPPTAYTSSVSDMDAGCRPFAPKPPACPTAVVPAPQPSPVVSPVAPAPVPFAPGAPRAPAAIPSMPSTPVVVPSAVPQIQATLPVSPAPAARRGPNMATIAIVGGAIVAVGLGVFLLKGKKKTSAPAKAA